MKTKWGVTASEPKIQEDQAIEQRNYEVARTLVIQAAQRGWSPTYKCFPVEKVQVYSYYCRGKGNYLAEAINITVTCNVESKTSFAELLFGADTRFVKALWRSQWRQRRIMLAGSDDFMELLGDELEKKGLIDPKRAGRALLPKFLEDSNKLLDKDTIHMIHSLGKII